MLIVYIKLMNLYELQCSTVNFIGYIASYGAFALLCLHYATTLATMKI